MASPSQYNAERTRLDVLLASTGRFPTRARARDAIARGSVRVNGQVVTKPGARFSPEDVVDITDDALRYVSRAALKLKAGLDHFGFDPMRLDALDIGASTGGFTQVLLERGAAHVTAIDVGHGQLHASLVTDNRVDSFEGVNARSLPVDLTSGRTIQVLVSDVSFISLKLALPPALELAAPGCFCVLLVKPQFEAGRDAIGKNGIIQDPMIGISVADDLADWLSHQPDWSSLGHCPSPLEGADGNREFLLGGVKAIQ
ncbi:MAG: TlyA family RNA methyltransferase [Alphaproteobacteria bacterium]|nr:TlyA family RNA methyltransferase [Alphaproteobacteria bacterium]